MGRRSAAVVAACAGLACACPVLAGPPVSVRPQAGNPHTVFHVSVPATFQLRDSRDEYWFSLHGRGGTRCERTLTERIGVTPPDGAKRVSADFPGIRDISGRKVTPGPWCPGTFSGRIWFSDWRPAEGRYRERAIGTFSFRVRATNK